MKKVRYLSLLVLFRYFYVLEVFMFQPYVCNGTHDVLMMSMNLSNVAILSIKGTDYRCIIAGISKTEIINLMHNINLSE